MWIWDGDVRKKYKKPLFSICLWIDLKNAKATILTTESNPNIEYVDQVAKWSWSMKLGYFPFVSYLC